MNVVNLSPRFLLPHTLHYRCQDLIRLESNILGVLWRGRRREEEERRREGGGGGGRGGGRGERRRRRREEEEEEKEEEANHQCINEISLHTLLQPQFDLTGRGLTISSQM